MKKWSVCLLCAIALVAGCRSVEQAHGKVRPSGFLRDYSMLKPGKEGEPQLFYRNPSFDPSAYDSIVIEPVTLWKEKGSQLRDVDPDQAQHLGKLWYSVIREEVGKVKKIAEDTGPRTLRLRAALTEATKGDAPLNLVTTVIPQSFVLREAGELVTGTRGFVGSAGGEAEIWDPNTGEVMAAGVGRLRGGDALYVGLDNWHDVESAMRFAAKRIAAQLQ